MSIANYGELKTAVADWTKRRDITARIPDFINLAHIKLVEYTGELTPMTQDGDTNELLNYNPFAYLYGALMEAYAYLRDIDQMSLYQAKFQKELDNLAMTGYDNIGGSPQVIPQ